MKEEKSRKTRKRLTPLELVDQKLEELSGRISKLEERVSEIENKTKRSFENYQKYFESLGEVIYCDFIILSENFRLMSLSHAPISRCDKFVSYIQRKERALRQITQMGMKPVVADSSSEIDSLVELSKRWNLSFEQIASYLLDKLGKDLAKEIVGKKSLMKYYGKEVIPIWEKLLEK